eukprot:m.7854 g.7854  ORF g.7854 m.7854 type:complete len:250 (-) comp5295_c0_seq2:133-882(-)
MAQQAPTQHGQELQDVCGFFLTGKCKFRKSCKNIHVRPPQGYLIGSAAAITESLEQTWPWPSPPPSMPPGYVNLLQSSSSIAFEDDTDEEPEAGPFAGEDESSDSEDCRLYPETDSASSTSDSEEDDRAVPGHAGGDGAASHLGEGQVAQKGPSKTPCTFYRKGICREGDRCRFAHVDTPTRAANVCTWYQISACKNPNCRYPHEGPQYMLPEHVCRVHYITQHCGNSHCTKEHELTKHDLPIEKLKQA